MDSLLRELPHEGRLGQRHRPGALRTTWQVFKDYTGQEQVGGARGRDPPHIRGKLGRPRNQHRGATGVRSLSL